MIDFTDFQDYLTSLTENFIKTEGLGDRYISIYGKYLPKSDLRIDP